MKPLTPALEQALDAYGKLYERPSDIPLTKEMCDILAAYRALPAVTGPWVAFHDRHGWYVTKGHGEIITAPDPATAQRYALALNVAEMNG